MENFDENKAFPQEEAAPDPQAAQPASEEQSDRAVNVSEEKTEQSEQQTLNGAAAQNGTEQNTAPAENTAQDVSGNADGHRNAAENRPAQQDPVSQTIREQPRPQQYAAARNMPDTQGMPPRSAPNMYGPYYGQPVYGGTYPPPAFQRPAPAQKKRRFSGVPLWIFISLISIAFIIIVILCVKISADSKNNSGSVINTANGDSASAAQPSDNRLVIRFEVAERPVLEDEMYADKETGLLTTVGVAKVILPSQVKINVFGDIPYIPMGSASGVILTEDGYILTNAHVVAEAKKISVLFYDDTEAEAYVTGYDSSSDIAVIKVNRTGLKPAQLGRSSGLNIGEEVAIAGAPAGYQNTVNYGHITGLDRSIMTDYSRNMTACIQCDVAHNSGNSGGALVNMYGQVIGIPVAIMPHEEYENISFSIAIDDVVPIVEDLIANGYVSTHARIGIEFISIGDEQAYAYGVPVGICVLGFDMTCNAAYSGIKQYDIITHIDGQRILTSDDVYEVLRKHIPGDVIKIEFARKEVTGEVKTLSTEVTLSNDNPAASQSAQNGYPYGGSDANDGADNAETNNAP